MEEPPPRTTREGLGRRQFREVMRKNFILKRRRPLETLIELASPFIFLLILWGMARNSGIDSAPADLPNRNLAMYPVDTLSKFGRLFIEGGSFGLDEARSLQEFLKFSGPAPLLGLDEFLWLRAFASAKVGELADFGKLYSLQRDFLNNDFGGLIVDGELMIADGCEPSCGEAIADFVEYMEETYTMWGEVFSGTVYSSFDEAENARVARSEAGYPEVEGDPFSTRSVWNILVFESLSPMDVRFTMRCNSSLIQDLDDTYNEVSRGNFGGKFHKLLWSGQVALQEAIATYALDRTLLSSTEVWNILAPFFGVNGGDPPTLSDALERVDAWGGVGEIAEVAEASDTIVEGRLRDIAVTGGTAAADAATDSCVDSAIGAGTRADGTATSNSGNAASNVAKCSGLEELLDDLAAESDRQRGSVSASVGDDAASDALTEYEETRAEGGGDVGSGVANDPANDATDATANGVDAANDAANDAADAIDDAAADAVGEGRNEGSSQAQRAEDVLLDEAGNALNTVVADATPAITDLADDAAGWVEQGRSAADGVITANYADVLSALLGAAGVDVDNLEAEAERLGLPPPPKKFTLNEAWVVPFPRPEYKFNRFFEKWGWVSGLVMAAACVYPVSRLINLVVEEKQIRMKSLLLQHGLRQWVFLASWAITYTLVFSIIALEMALFLVNNIYFTTSTWLVWLFMSLYLYSMMSLTFAVSTLFNRAKLASIVMPVIAFLLLLPAYIFTFYPRHRYLASKRVLCIFPPTAFAFGVEVFSSAEVQNDGLQFQQSSFDGDGRSLSLGFILEMLIADFFIYGVLAWYLDRIIAVKYGTRLPWYFPLLPAFWFGDNASAKAQDRAAANVQMVAARADAIRSDDNESDKSEAVAVSIRGLRKEYTRGKKLALKGLDLDMYYGEVTCLLGTNGAGKSTTINILTGLYEPTDGTAEIYGLSITREINEVRKVLSVCPQHDVLYPDLTVKEHLRFFSVLKGVADDDLDRAIELSISSVALQDKTNAFAASLSGGQRRKLSLANAMAGDPKLVVLDEPTTGMDPQARRTTWEMILKARRSRAILLTTHFLDEADLLGDRIAIMRLGELQECGTSMELKSRCGMGYSLTMFQTPKHQMDRATTVSAVAAEGATNSVPTALVLEGDVHDSANHGNVPSIRREIDELPGRVRGKPVGRVELLATVRSVIPSALLISDNGSETTMQLPLEQRHKFPDLIQKLERHKFALKLESMGIAMTTLEEVFLSLASQPIDSSLNPDVKKSFAKGPSFSENEALALTAAGEAKGTGVEHQSDESLDSSGKFVGKAAASNLAGMHKSYERIRSSHMDQSGRSPQNSKKTAKGQGWNVAADSRSVFSQFLSQMMKRWIMFKRDRVAIVQEILMPILLVAVAVIILESGGEELESIKLELDQSALYGAENSQHSYLGNAPPILRADVLADPALDFKEVMANLNSERVKDSSSVVDPTMNQDLWDFVVEDFFLDEVNSPYWDKYRTGQREAFVEGCDESGCAQEENFNRRLRRRRRLRGKEWWTLPSSNSARTPAVSQRVVHDGNGAALEDSRRLQNNEDGREDPELPMAEAFARCSETDPNGVTTITATCQQNTGCRLDRCWPLRSLSGKGHPTSNLLMYRLSDEYFAHQGVRRAAAFVHDDRVYQLVNLPRFLGLSKEDTSKLLCEANKMLISDIRVNYEFVDTSLATSEILCQDFAQMSFADVVAMRVDMLFDLRLSNLAEASEAIDAQARADAEKEAKNQGYELSERASDYTLDRGSEAADNSGATYIAQQAVIPAGSIRRVSVGSIVRSVSDEVSGFSRAIADAAKEDGEGAYNDDEDDDEPSNTQSAVASSNTNSEASEIAVELARSAPFASSLAETVDAWITDSVLEWANDRCTYVSSPRNASSNFTTTGNLTYEKSTVRACGEEGWDNILISYDSETGQWTVYKATRKSRRFEDEAEAGDDIGEGAVDGYNDASGSDASLEDLDEEVFAASKWSANTAEAYSYERLYAAEEALVGKEPEQLSIRTIMTAVTGTELRVSTAGDRIERSHPPVSQGRRKMKIRSPGHLLHLTLSAWLSVSVQDTIASPLDEATGGLSSVKMDFIFGNRELNFTIPVGVTLMHNRSMFFAIPAALAARAQAPMTLVYGETAKFVPSYHPLKNLEPEENALQKIFMAFFVVLFTLVPFCFTPGCYSLHVVHERSTRASHLLAVSGLSPRVYWATTFLFDFLCYFVVASCTMMIFSFNQIIYFGEDDFGSYQIANATILLFILYGWAVIPLSYLIGFIFENPQNAQLGVAAAFFVSGWGFTVLHLAIVTESHLQEEAELARDIFLWFPPFVLSDGLVSLTTASIENRYFGTRKDVFAYEILGRLLWTLTWQGCVFIVLVLVVHFARTDNSARMAIDRFHENYAVVCSPLARGLKYLMRCACLGGSEDDDDDFYGGTTNKSGAQGSSKGRTVVPIITAAAAQSGHTGAGAHDRWMFEQGVQDPLASSVETATEKAAVNLNDMSFTLGGYRGRRSTEGSVADIIDPLELSDGSNPAFLKRTLYNEARDGATQSAVPDYSTYRINTNKSRPGFADYHSDDEDMPLALRQSSGPNPSENSTAGGPTRRQNADRGDMDARFVFDEPPDVKEERVRIDSGQSEKDQDVLQLKHLRKRYPAKSLFGEVAKAKVAVRNLSLGVKRGECFGFLGTNGAGKSTTMSVISGQVVPSEGDAIVGGRSCVSEIKEVQRLIGYCPQHDALHGRLTAREHLTMYSRVKGIPEAMIPGVVSELLEVTTLGPFADRQAETFSGGNMRKLSFAIAMLGNPSLVLLDEPSSGMDPHSRRAMWDVIVSTLNEDRAIVLTTHSMDECEAICTRIGIMVNGVLRCLGSAQNLKDRFGSAYQLELATDDVRATKIRSFLSSRHPDWRLVEAYNGRIRIHVPRRSCTLAQLFKEIEANRTSIGITEYGISQSSLEQVFMQVANLHNSRQSMAPSTAANRGTYDNPQDVNEPSTSADTELNKIVDQLTEPNRSV